MLYHLVIIGDGFPDEPPPISVCCFGCQQPNPEKPGPNGDQVALLWRYKSRPVDYGPRGEIGWNTRWPDPKLEALLSR